MILRFAINLGLNFLEARLGMNTISQKKLVSAKALDLVVVQWSATFCKLSFWLLILIGSYVEAQFDPSAAALLKSRGQTPHLDRLNPGRYKVKQPDVEPKKVILPPVQNLQKIQPAATSTTPLVLEKVTSKSEVSTQLSDEKVAQKTELKTVQKVESAQEESPSVDSAGQKPPTSTDQELGQQVRDLVLGGNQKSIDEYREQLHPEDPRNNLMIFEVASTFVYLDSVSNYWFRNYAFSAPGYSLGADIWLTPFFGIHSQFQNLLGPSIRAEANSENRLTVEQQYFDGGFRWRSFTGANRRSTSFTFGVDYTDRQTRVAKSSTARSGVQSTGVKLSAVIKTAFTNHFFMELGGEFSPWLSHKELSTALGLKSGNHGDSSLVGIWIGTSFHYNRELEVFWRLHQSLERNLFEKAASDTDPKTGENPTGVTVTTGTTFFTMGLRWGN